jgi:hypothetical protein
MSPLGTSATSGEETAATHGARDISAFGGWRAFMALAKISA